MLIMPSLLPLRARHATPAGVPFPKNFRETVRNIVRRLFRVYAHLYNHHFAQLCALSLEGEIAQSIEDILRGFSRTDP